jgi:seryl-tRNA synthetase
VNPLGHIDPAARSDYHISTECVLSASDENNEPRQVKEKIIQVEMQQTQESSNMRQLVASKNQFSGEVGQSLKQLDEQEKLKLAHTGFTIKRKFMFCMF